jgi:twitching motility protein PilT
MGQIIKAAVERGASDLHIEAGDLFRARINGRLVPLTKQAMNGVMPGASGFDFLGS